MSNFEVVDQQDEYLQTIKGAKAVQAVTKIDFAAFASAIPDEFKIFAYEGTGDKSIYYHWIKHIRPSLQYEPYICRNKANTLQLFDSLQADRTGLGNRIYYFVDRDFDDLQGRSPHERIFVTDKYSIENYLVSPSLLDDLLKIEFHCDGYPAERKYIQDIFEELYNMFLESTADINFRVFVARKHYIKQTDDLPERINLLARVELTRVIPSGRSPAELVKLEREPTEAEVNHSSEDFKLINPNSGYRGKFALLFFIRWLSLLREDRASDNSTLFPTVPRTEFSIHGNFSLETLASKAPMPEKLHKFLCDI